MTRNEQRTPCPVRTCRDANSIYVYSGLEDGDDNDDGIPELPNGPGVAPQNWGHVQKWSWA